MPAFFDSDLAIYKTFHITERHTVEFRVTANNFLNHPLVGYSNSNFLTLKYSLDPTNKGGGYTFVPPAGNVTATALTGARRIRSSRRSPQLTGVSCSSV